MELKQKLGRKDEAKKTCHGDVLDGLHELTFVDFRDPALVKNNNECLVLISNVANSRSSLLESLKGNIFFF